MSLESKDATCVGSLCERANSHGTRDFAGDTDLQAPFRNDKLVTLAKFMKENKDQNIKALKTVK